MAIQKVAVLGHPVLRQVAKPVPEKEIKSSAVKNLIQDMLETMAEYDGRGLAAPQIHQSLQIVVMLWDFDPDEKATLAVLINPVIQALTTETSGYWEGCLSIPGMRGLVHRPNKISVKAFNQKAEKIEFVAEGFCATVVQHECDHLQGKLYIDRMRDLTHFAFNREYQKYWAEENESNDEEASEG